MADVYQRIWKSGPRRVRKTAWGYTLQLNGRQIRMFNAAWTREQAEDALAARRLGLTSQTSRNATLTFGEAIERYLTAKARKKSVAFDRLYLSQLKSAFGVDTPLADISAPRVAAWRDERLAAVCPRTKKLYAAASVNRPLAALRHLLQLAHDEWGALAAVPRIRLAKEPQGRIRWLEPDEEARLLAACAKSRNPELVKIVTVALETGLRRGELLGLTWDRVDLSRGVIRLEVTKSGKRREVPMRQAVYDVLSSLLGPREGRVFRTRSIRTAFEYAVVDAGLDDLRLHDCRHHFASWFVMRGGSLQALKEVLGHASLTMTMRYSHLSPGHLRAEIEKTSQPSPFSTQSAQRLVSELASREGVA